MFKSIKKYDEQIGCPPHFYIMEVRLNPELNRSLDNNTADQ